MKSFKGAVEKAQKVYVKCASVEEAQEFLKKIEQEGFMFSDGSKPTEKENSDLFVLEPPNKVCYAGFAGHARMGAGNEEGASKVSAADYLN